MTLLVARKNILHWDADRASHPVDLSDPWFGGQVIEPGSRFSVPEPAEVARLVVAGAARVAGASMERML